jgi:2-phosphosulfolactate phosphatase
MTADRVAGRTLLMTTTNGTAVLLATHGAWHTYVGAFVNLSVTAERVMEALRDGRDAVLVCAGQDRRFALEDAACAGVLVARTARGVRGAVLGDAARMVRRMARRYTRDVQALATDAAHARSLAEAGFEEDVPFCLAHDRTPVLATYADRQVTGERINAAA